MEKKVLMSVAVLLLGMATMNAQSIFDKIDNMVNKVDNATNTADRASKTGGKVTSIFGKKKHNQEKGVENQNKTVIRISNIDFTNLKKLNTIISETKNVSGTEMKFNQSSSSIIVLHSGNTEKLLDNIQSKAQNIFTDKNVSGIDEGMIEIKIK